MRGFVAQNDEMVHCVEQHQKKPAKRKKILVTYDNTNGKICDWESLTKDLLLSFYFFVYLCACVYVCHMYAGTCRSQTKVPDPWKL